MSDELPMPIEKVMEMLPHRYPFLLVDQILAYDLENKTLVAKKNVTRNEPFFDGHFPQYPLMPGVLLVEALAQASGLLMSLLGYKEVKVLTAIQEAKFRTGVRPGDTLHLSVKCEHISRLGGRVSAQALIQGEKELLAAEAQIKFSILKQKI